jgi:hypothetical protein
MAGSSINRVDQYDVVHDVLVDKYWSHAQAHFVDVVHMRCGIRIVTMDTSDPVTCINCLTGARD